MDILEKETQLLKIWIEWYTGFLCGPIRALGF